MSRPTLSSEAVPTHRLVTRQAAGSPDAVAVVDSERTLTYAELDAAANRLAHVLREAGVDQDVPVGVCLNRGVHLVVALLAVWRAGGSFVPLAPEHPRRRITGVLAAARIPVVLTEDALRERTSADGVRQVVLDAGLTVADGRPETAPPDEVTGDHAAYVLHTSGSTGTPKGVVVGHAGIGNRIDWVVRTHNLGAGDRVLQKTALTFDAACWEVFAPLVSGGTVVLAPVGSERDPAVLVRSVIEHEITILQVVPSVLRVLVEEPGWAECTSLRLLFSAGEPLHAELVQRFRKQLPRPTARALQVWNTYGPTECSIDVTAYRVDPMQRSGPVPIGTPIEGMRVLVADEDGTPVEPGEPGELYAGGVGVARGYLHRPDLTAERFVPDPAEPGARLYRTGDLVRTRPDGNLEYLGRADHQLKINGVRIEPGEIEAALAGHPDLRGAVVAPFTAKDGSTRLAAYVAARHGSAPSDLREFLADRLPETHLPAVVVELAEFPTTASGKVDRAALPDPDLSGAPESAAPHTAAERLVADVWQDLLHLDEVSTGDDFFQLGGSSLQFTRLANRLRKATGQQLDLPRLLSATTVAEQALLLRPAAESDVDSDRIGTVERGGGLALSFGQRRIWVMDRMKPRSREWVSALFLRVPAVVSAEAVGQALDHLVARHESLRTRFAVVDGEPVQVIDAPGGMELLTVRTTGDEFATLLDAELDRGFDVATGPLVRALLAAGTSDTPDAEQVLVISMHHIVCDGWSAAILEREFHEALAAVREGRGVDLPALPVQYADFAAWQRARLDDTALATELAHWRTVLDGAAPLVLRTDKPRPSVRDAHGSMVAFTVPADVTTALEALGRRHGATPFMTLLTAFGTLLARHTAQWDVVVGTPVAGRERPEVEGVVGFFLNSLVLRLGLDGEQSFDRALDTVRDACRDAFAHQRLPFERLVAELAPERDLSRTPLYQVAFDLHDEKLTGSAADRDDLDTLVEVSRIAKTDLTLYMRTEADGSMTAGLEYATALFDHATIERMAGHFQRLLGSVAADPAARLDTVDFLPDAERQTLARVSATPALPFTGVTPELFERQAAATPAATALITDTDRLSYVDVDERANQLAHHLRGHGVGPESVVAVLLDRGVDLMTGLLAVWKAGAAYLPLDPDLPAERIAYVLDDADVAVMLTQSAHYNRFGVDVDTKVDARTVLVDGDAERIAAEPVTAPRRHTDPDQLAYLIYTSGSTGRPKGVQVTHRGLANHLHWAVAELAGRGVGGAAVFSSVAFDLVVPNVWAPLLTGRSVHLLPQDLDLTELGDRLSDAAPFGFLKLTPGHLEILSHQVRDEWLADLAEVIVVAGEALPVRLAERWASALGAGRLINEYGPTEASVGTCVYPITAPVTGDTVPIGRPLPGVTMHVLDGLLRPAPIGVVGEVYVGGVGVARGYANRPELTAERFVPDPHGAPGARLYRTGDLARVLPSGDVDFLARLDDQVKIRGYRVELGEIRTVLADHADVRAAVVLAETDPSGNTRVVAHCVPTAERDGLAADLTAHCATRLPEYMVPAVITLIERVPLNANGKLDKAALPRAGETPVDAVVAPRGVVEERIAEIFCELLGTTVGAHSHFFQAGGNSILAIRLVAAVQSSFEIDLPIRVVFEGPTVAELAEVVEAKVRAEIDEMSEAELLARD